MLDTCVIRAVTGHGDPDPETGKVQPVYGAPVYQGRCKLQSQQPAASTPNAGDRVYTVNPLFLKLPVDGTEGVVTGMVAEILECPGDPANVGRVFRVRSGDRKSYATAFRPIVEEVT